LAALGAERYGLWVKDVSATLKKSAEATSRMASRGTKKRQEDTSSRNDYEAMDLNLARIGKQTLS